MKLNDQPLFDAVDSCNIAMVRTALSQGADVNTRDTTGHTPLMLAAKSKNVDIVRLLLDQGSDITMTLRDSDGEEETALMYAGYGTTSTNPVFELLYDQWATLWKKSRPIPQEQARLFLNAYSCTPGRVAFHLKNGEVLREGYFWVEPYADVIMFSWAPGPMDSSSYYDQPERPIPFEDIDLDSLYW